MKIKTSPPKVTILIANYNNAKFIDECINSILKQEYNNIEIIVIDDVSSDNSIKILKKYIKKIKIIKIRKKIGLGFINQMNCYYQGIKKAKGEFVCFLDSDDFFDKKKILYVVNFFLKHPQKIFYFDLPIILNNKKITYIKNKKKFIKTYWPYFPPTSCISVRKKYLNRIFKIIYKNEFSDIWMDFRICICAKYIFKDFNLDNRNLTFYRKTENNISSNFVYLSRNWWRRRLQAHYYLFFFFKKNKLYFKKNIDFILTKVINFLI